MISFAPFPKMWFDVFKSKLLKMLCPSLYMLKFGGLQED